MHKIALAPTTLPNSPPLEYIDAAVRAGYDGIGIRLSISMLDPRGPGLPQPPTYAEKVRWVRKPRGPATATSSCT